MVKRTWLFLAIFLSGCATYQGFHSSGVKLNIGTFTNFTYESGLSKILREELSEEASFFGIEIGGNKNSLEGEIKKVDYYPILLNEDKEIVELKAKIVVKVRLIENGEKLWEKEFQEEDVSFLKGYWKETRRELLEKLCRKLARKIFYEVYRRKNS